MSEPVVEGSEQRSKSTVLQWVGRLGGPLLAMGVYAILPGGPGELSPEGRAAAAIGVLMAALWMTEALPLPVTSLLPLVLFPLSRVMTLQEAATPFANEVIYLFLGGFLLALGMEKWGLHRRMALHLLVRVGPRPSALLGGFMVATGMLSMWISNTAAAMVMLPIGTSIIELSRAPTASAGGEAVSSSTDAASFSTMLLLGIAYAASIGSLATPIGTPPNLFLRAFVGRTYGLELGFGSWMLLGLPLAGALMLGAWWILLRMHPLRMKEIGGGRAVVREELLKLGSMTRGEKVVLVVFGAAVLGWLVRDPLSRMDSVVQAWPWIGRMTDAGVALTAAVALFVLPVNARRGEFALDWSTAKKLPWDILLLFGGGLSLAGAIQSTGVSTWLGAKLAGVGTVPLVVLVLAVTMLIIFLTELTSNTATAATFLPLLAGLAIASGTAPMLLLLPATLAATCAFMLPVATPPNAIVFGGGQVRMAQMARAGFWLNLLAVGLISFATLTLGRWLF
jgi:sodium-dependent dicarboxylate transporter 2/3/5